MKTTLLNYLLLISFICCYIPNILNAEENKYDVNEIPIELRIGADAVIRNHSVRFEIEDESSAFELDTFVVTIFNKDEQRYGDLVLHYDNFIDIDDLDGRILDSKGEEIRDLDDKDIKDYSAFSDYSLYMDSRVRVAQLYYNKFPYTIEYTYRLNYIGYINWPSWHSRNTLDPVELSKFEVLVPDNYKLRYWCNDKSVKPEILHEGKLYSWRAENLKELSYEAVGEDIEDVMTIVNIAPSDFEIEGYKGNMNSWKDFGLWVYNLFKGKDVLSQSAAKEINSIILPGDNEKQKVLKLYKYLQSTTRYVSVTLGVGAWQPFDAMYVHDRSYGDCKALSNYMVSLLKVAGIAAYPVLINNGDHRLPLITEFPSNQFNHVIVCVPLEKDTTWLECTNQNILAGNIGWSNENRGALMITPGGGVIVNTPRSSSKQNMMQKKIEVTFSSNTALINGIIKWDGDQQNSVRSVAKKDVPKDREKWILKSFEVPDVSIKDYSFYVADDSTNNVNLKLNLYLPKYATVSGSRIFFNPNLMQRRSYVPDKVSERLSPIRFSYPYHDIDTIIYKIPQGYKVEAVPDEMNLSSSFGNFSSRTIKDDDGNLLYVRSLEIKVYEIPAENYNEYRNFLSEVVKTDRLQVVLVKNN